MICAAKQIVYAYTKKICKSDSSFVVRLSLSCFPISDSRLSNAKSISKRLLRFVTGGFAQLPDSKSKNNNHLLRLFWLREMANARGDYLMQKIISLCVDKHEMK